MPPRSEASAAVLADDESVVTRVPATFLDGSRRARGVLVVTDRRLLFHSGDGRFTDVVYDAIDSIRSRPRTTFTARGLGCRVLAVLGAVVAAAAALGVLGIGASPLALALVALTVGGAVGAEHVNRHGLDLRGTALTRIDPWLRGEGDDGDGVRPFGVAIPYGDDRESLVLGFGCVAMVSLIGLIVLTESLFVVPLVFAALGGTALAGYAIRRKRSLDAFDESRCREREVTVRLGSGRSVRLRVEAAARIDHELSGLARATIPPANEDRIAPPLAAEASDGAPNASPSADSET